MRRNTGLWAVLGIVILCAWAKPAFSQGGVSAAQLNGTVKDASGGSVANATLTLRDVGTNRTYTAVSNDNGLYIIPNLPPGTYELTTEATGFAKSTQTGIVLTVGQVATIDVNVSVAQSAEKVVVTTETPPVEPTRTEVSQVIDTKQIQNLPISGRVFTDFALLTPGVATGRTSLQSTITEFEVTRISFGGMRDLSNAVTVDGADTINTATGSQRSTPSQEAVSEFRVVNNGFGAEYGRALGGIVNIVTKSGTNELHGSAYDYLQNNATDARSLLQPAPQADDLRQNQFGGTLGGPIKKDETFFFMNYEGQRRAESPTYPSTLVGPVALSNGTQSTELALINQAKEAMGLPPENLNILTTMNTDNGIIKIDHQINKNNRLSVRYNAFDGRELNLLVGDTLDGGGIGAPSSGHDAFIRDQDLVGIVNSQISPNLVNTALVQYARRHYNFPGVTGQPNLDIPNDLLFGHNFGVLDAIYESRVQATDSVAWVKGQHLAKFGVDTNFINNFVIWPGFTPMRIVLPGINCLVEFANFVNPGADIPTSLNPGDTCPLPPSLDGTPIVFWGAPVGSGPVAPGFEPPSLCPATGCTPSSWSNAYLPSQAANFSETLNHSYYGFYAQDQWRLTPKLTFNYGLRWDFEKGLEKQINPDYRGWQPRVGLAYAPDRHTVIRAGFGMFDDRFNLSFLFITQPQKPVIIPNENLPGIRAGANSATWVLNQLTPGPPNPGGQMILPAQAAATLITTGMVPPEYITGPPGTTVTAGAGMVDHNSRIPYSEQATLQIDRELGHGLVISAGYLFVSAHKLVRAEDLNICPTTGTTNVATTCAAAGAPPPDWPTGKANFSGVLYTNAGLLYFTDNSGNSVYHGGTLQATQHLGQY
ncbi:MAG: TonB-dependent receptor, partial [Candidatus Acidiferrum sp.]